MTWTAAVPVAALAAAWCVLPGFAVARALGWRGIACWGAAPLISIAMIAVTAIVVGHIGVPWGAGPVTVATIVAASAALICRALAQRWIPSVAGSVQPVVNSVARPASSWRSTLRPHGLDGEWAGLALTIGIGVAIVIGWVTVVLGFGPVDAISATYDGVHHYSAVARILTTGDASSLTLGELTNPGRPKSYPAAWHDLVSLLVLTSGATVPIASNIVALVVAVIVWPLSCVLLVRQIVGRRPGAFLVTPILATAFTAMPWSLMAWGVLWPNLLGLALVPVALAALLSLLGLTRDSAIGRPGAIVLGAVAIPALMLAHPNAVLSFLVLGFSPLLVAAAVTAFRRGRDRRYLGAIAAPIGALVLVGVIVWLLAWAPFLASLRMHDWPVSMGAAEAIRGIASNGTDGHPALVVVSVLVAVGAVLALRAPRTAWLVPAHLTSAFLYLLAAARDNPLSTALTGAWYNDSHRLAAMLPITGVPLAALGLIGVAGLAVQSMARLRGIELPTARRHLITTGVVAIIGAGIVLASDGLRIGVHAFVVAQTYQREATWMLQPGQREFLDEVGRIVPVGSMVAADPWTGNALLYPLTGRQTMFPHMMGNWTPAQQVLRVRLRDAATDPSVCAAVRATGLTYAISGPVSYWPWHPLSRTYPGLADLDQAPGFEPVASGGGSTLYRITACGGDGGSAAG